MSGKIRLGKTATSRTRAKAKIAVIGTEELKLKERLGDQFIDFIDYLLAKGFSSRTIERYVYDTKYFEGWTKAENIEIESANYADVLHYIQVKKKTVKQRSISSLTNSLKHYYNYLLGTKIVKENPVLPIKIKGVKRKVLYTILSKKELESLYQTYDPKLDEQYKNCYWYKTNLLAVQRNKVILGLIIYQGLNATDLIKLKMKDLKLREGKIFIAGNRRSNERELKLESVQILDLMEYTLKVRAEFLELTATETDRLFISNTGREDLGNVLFKLSNQLKNISSKVNGLKQIRSSVIVGWLKIYNLREAQYMAGHRYISSTEGYLINDLEGLQEDITKFHPIS